MWGGSAPLQAPSSYAKPAGAWKLEAYSEPTFLRKYEIITHVTWKHVHRSKIQTKLLFFRSTKRQTGNLEECCNLLTWLCHVGRKHELDSVTREGVSCLLLTSSHYANRLLVTYQELLLKIRPLKIVIIPINIMVGWWQSYDINVWTIFSVSVIKNKRT